MMNRAVVADDDYSSLTLWYPGGVRADSVQATDRLIERNAVITGTKGSIFLPDFQHAVKMTVQSLDKEAWDVELPVEINGFEYEIREVSHMNEEWPLRGRGKELQPDTQPSGQHSADPADG